jgi:hypothetical protein
MRRWAGLGFLATVVPLVIVSSVVGVRGFNRACDGSLEGLRYLTTARPQLASATAPPPATPQPTPTQAPGPTLSTTAPPTPVPAPSTPPPPTVVQRFRDVVGMAGDAAIVALIEVKQNDLVAYPAHILAAYMLDLAGCGQDAVRLQWLKASLHAATDDQTRYIATALVASTTDPTELADLRRVGPHLD